MHYDVSDPGSDSLLPTRRSLLSSLRDWRDEQSWREFFETYWRLMYRVARNAGLADAEAQEVVQDNPPVALGAQGIECQGEAADRFNLRGLVRVFS